ncbi:metal ABC transporter substrate-binding protein [Heyndrickxia vini]|uniref:Zinc ABC transporter substrate-binding protein n=1 Tax=Heyndrickxia vini TaxID=1476025 RepID=A0ABX7EAF7_9BACI|nr:metal ABC transporter substrate-binding protein [Heyndrickxia vini]QQZ11497.1 zinc ABC transporter substrate-binding protein [Heyndrickxia vini]
MTFLIISGCGTNNQANQKNTSSNNKLQIVTTFYPMYEFTKNVVKDKADVKLLIPSNVEPHDWEPTPKDVGRIQKANIFVYNSKYFETWVPSIKNSVSNGNLSFVEASNDIQLMSGNGHHQFDPHVWLNPVLAQQEVKTITKALIKVDPKNKGFYQKNSAEYIAKLAKLDDEYRNALKGAKKKEIITQHTAFGYLAKEYGLKQIPIAGLSPSQEPSPARLGELKEFAVKHHVKVIYFEELASPKVAETLANEVGAKTEVLHTLEGLSKEEQDKGMNYISVMQKNLEAIKKSLFD